MKFEIARKEITEIIIGKDEKDLRKIPLRAEKLLIITDKFCGKKFSNAIKKAGKLLGKNKKIFVLKRNDKSFSALEKALFCLLKNNFSRQDAVLAVGGGTVCDLASLAASLYMRGMKLCLVPTTFLAQIDAAFGGKNAADLGGYRNMIGLFRQPDYIFCAVDFFSEKEIIEGFGELVKYFLLAPKAFGKDKRAFFGKIKKSRIARRRCVEICLKIKSDFVSADPLDIKGVREYLNLGHTAAHAFESASKGKVSHGNAVFLGLKYELLLSREIFQKDPPQLKVFAEYEKFVPKIKIPKQKFSDFLAAVKKDKKNRGGKNAFFLFSPGGEIVKIKGIKESVLKRIFRSIANEHSGN